MALERPSSPDRLSTELKDRAKRVSRDTGNDELETKRNEKQEGRDRLSRDESLLPLRGSKWQSEIRSPFKRKFRFTRRFDYFAAQKGAKASKRAIRGAWEIFMEFRLNESRCRSS